MSCINKSLPAYKELVSKYGDTIAESMVRTMTTQKNMKNIFHIPTISEASSYMKNLHSNIEKNFKNEVSKKNTPSRSEIISRILPLIEVKDNVMYVNTGLKPDVTNKLFAETDVFIPSLQTLLSLEKSYPDLIKISEPKGKRNIREVFILGDNQYTTNNDNVTYKGKKYDTYQQALEAFINNLFGDFTDSNKKTEIKQGVSELFESNTEFANSVYEALGFKIKADVILPIGTSGSGKSTFIKSLLQENLVAIEPDAMRVEFTGDMNNKSKDKEIYEEAANRAIQAIKQGKQVVFDTTNLTKAKRLPFIEAIKKAIPTANIQYKLMELNPELAKQRIKAQLARGENRAAVSDETIDRHAASYKQMLEDIKNEPISNFEITPQQKQQAQQLYSQYLEQNPNGNVEGFKNWVEEFNKNNKLLQESGSLTTISKSKIDNLQSTVEYQLLNEKDEDLDKKIGQSYMFLSEKDAQRFTYLVERNKEFPEEFKVTKKITKYEKDSKNPLKFNGYNEYVDFYYIKSNKNKKSNLYDIVNKETGEVIASKVRVLSVSKDSKSEIAKKYGLEHTPTKIFSANRSIAFALYRQKPSKAKYIAQAKKYLYDAIKFLNPEETNLKINLDKIEELLSSFPEEMWDYINTTYSPEDSTNINASISLQNEIKFNLPKLGFIQEIEKITGLKLLGVSFKNYDRTGSLAKIFKFSKLDGEWGSTITIDNSMTTKELQASIRYYLSTKNVLKPTTEEENVRKYAEHRGIDYNELKELVFGDIDKALDNISYNNTGNSDTIELSKWRESIRNYDWQSVELFSKPYENFQNTVKERIIAKFKDKNLSNGISHLEYFFNSGSFNWLNINFNNISGQYYLSDMETEANVGVETKMGGIINPFEMKIYQKPKAGENFLQEKEVFNRLAAVLHEPFHALHALSYGTTEELELRKAFDNLYNTTFGKEMMNQVFGSGYNKGQQISYDTLYKEFTAFTTQLMLYPKQWIKNTDLRSNDIYEFIEKIQTLQDKTYEEIVKTQQKIGTTEKTITEEEQIKLSFLEKLYNYLVKALNKIIPLSKKFTNLIVDSKLVEKKVIEDVFGEVEETVTKTLKLPDNVKKSKEQFLEVMEELQSAINTLMQIDGKLFSSENITNFFTSNKFNQEVDNNQSNVQYQKQIDLQAEQDDVLEEFANSLSERFNISFDLVSEEDARAMFPKYTNEPAFFDPKTKKAYLVKGKANKTSAVHEIFTHPFLLQIEKTNPTLYKNLLKEAKNNKSVVDYVNNLYGTNQNNDHEYIARAIDLAVQGELDQQKDKTLLGRIQDFFNQLSDYLKKLFNIPKVFSSAISPNITLQQLTQFAMYGKGKMNLNPAQENVEYSLKATDVIVKNLDKIKQWEKNKSISEDVLWNKIQGLGVPKEQIELVKNSEGNTIEEKLSSFVANYSYTIEINTAKEKLENYEMVDITGEGDFEPKEFIPDTDFIDTYDDEGNIIGMEEVLSEKGKKQIEERENKRKPTQYYSNLSAPGGTNYTENGHIIPELKGKVLPYIYPQHDSEFAGGKLNMFGWDRSDDKVSDLEEPKFFELNGILYQKKGDEYKQKTSTGRIYQNTKKNHENALTKWRLKNAGVTKTRRILEVQSKFQKWRLNFEHKGNKYQILENQPIHNKPYEYEDHYLENGKRITSKEYNKIYKEFLNTPTSKEDAFIKLIAKQWETIMIKNIIQKAAKQGYGKVLFPTGDTASKIEGHTTLEEFKKQKEDRIKELENFNANTKNLKVATDKDGFFTFSLDGVLQNTISIYGGRNTYRTEDAAKKGLANIKNILEKNENEINQLKEELERVEREGFAALRPIYNFYENTVTNILKKQGYNPVEITDEYGNTWNEVTIDENRDNQNIVFQKTPQKNDSQTFFNLNDVDAKRKSINNSLKELLNKVLSQIRIIQVDDNGNPMYDAKGDPILKHIDILSLEEYHKEYSNRNPGTTLTALGFADMIYGLLAATDEDGITYPEEALHFILWSLKDHDGFPKFWEMRDAQGKLLMSQTDVWKNNEKIYREKYAHLPNVDEMVQLEIAAKMLAQYMYDIRAINSPVNKIKNAIYKSIEKLLSLFRIGSQFKRKELEFYPDQLKEILHSVDKDLENLTHFKEHGQLKPRVLQNPNPIILGVVTKLDRLRSIKSLLNAVKTRYSALVSQALQEGIHWTEFVESFEKSGIDEYNVKTPLISVKQLDLNQIGNYQKYLQDELNNNPGDVDIQRKLGYTNTLYDNFEYYTKSYKDGGELISLKQRIEDIDRQLKIGTFEEGLNIAIFGRGNIKLIDYNKIADYDPNNYGIIQSMHNMATKINELLANPTTIRVEHVKDAQMVLDTLMPIVNIVQEHLNDNNQNLFEANTSPNEIDRNDRVREAIKNIKNNAKLISEFIEANDTHYHAMSNLYISEINENTSPGLTKKLQSFVDKHTPRIFSDMSSYKYMTGFMGNIKEDWGKLFIKKVKTVNQKIKSITIDEARELQDLLDSNGYNDLSRNEIKEIFYQLNGKGEHTGYLMSKWDIAKWENAKKQHRLQVIKELKNEVADSNDLIMKNIHISNDYKDLQILFAPLIGLNSSDLKKLAKSNDSYDQKLLRLWELRDIYGKSWSDWHKTNSAQLSDNEVNIIKSIRKRQLSAFHYKQWLYDNIKTYVTAEGTIKPYYSGELLTPNPIKYTNPYWHRLTPSKKKLATIMNEFLINKKLKATPDKYSLEWYYRAPQIRSEGYDIVGDKNWFSKTVDATTGNFFHRSDDDYFNKNENGMKFKHPPLRYNKMLENPKLLTSDIVYAAFQYSMNVNTRTEFLKELPELEGMLLSVETGTVKRHKVFGKTFFSDIIDGSKSSNLYKAMESILDSEIFGNTHIGFEGKEHLNKALITGKKYVTDTNLAYNLPAALVSALSSIVDKVVSSAVGDIIDTENHHKGVKELTRNFKEIMSEFENPKKTTKLGILAQNIGIGSKVNDHFRRTNRSKAYRKITSIVKPYSLWTAGEHAISLPNVASVGYGIRKINDRWIDMSEAKRQGVYGKDEWKNAITLYDTLQIKDGKIDLNGIPQGIYDYYVTKVNYATSQFSQTTTEEDRGYIQKHVFLSYFAIHMSYIFQTIDKMSKPAGYNWESGQYEVGYYTQDSFKFALDTFYAAIKDVTNFVRADFSMTNYKNMLDLSGGTKEDIKEAYVRNFHRIKLQMGVVASLSMLVYIIMGLALEDDDDGEKNPLLQLAALLVLKLKIEQSAKLSFTDIYDFAQRPVANLDGSLNRFQFLDTIWDSIFGEEDIYKQRGVYKGMDERYIKLIKTTPYLKGIFENYIGGFVNSDAYGSWDVTQAEGYAQKRDAIRSIVVEKTGYASTFRSTFDLLSLPPSVFGNTIGQLILYMTGNNYYKNSSIINNKLPSKQANKDN